MICKNKLHQEELADSCVKWHYFMDHSRRKNTERYTARAEEYSQRHNYDWFKRILKDRNRKCRGKYAEKSKQSPKTLVSHGNPSREEYSPDQIRTGD